MNIDEFRKFMSSQRKCMKYGKYAFLTDSGNYYLSNSQKAISKFSKENKIICFFEWLNFEKCFLATRECYREFSLEHCSHFIK